VRGLVYVDNRLEHSYTPEDLDFLNAVSLYASRGCSSGPRSTRARRRRYGGSRGPKKKTFSEEAMQLLFRHRWPFNVRELQQVVERAVCVVDHDVILPKDLPDYLRLTASASAPAEAAASAKAPVAPDVRPALSASTFPPLKEVVENVERDHIVRALEVAGGSKRRASSSWESRPRPFTGDSTSSGCATSCPERTARHRRSSGVARSKLETRFRVSKRIHIECHAKRALSRHFSGATPGTSLALPPVG